MTRFFNESGAHDGISDQELAKDLRDLRGVERLLRNGTISQQQYEDALNVMRPPEGTEPGLGDLVHDRHQRGDYRSHVSRKRGRKSFDDLGEGR